MEEQANQIHAETGSV